MSALTSETDDINSENGIIVSAEVINVLSSDLFTNQTYIYGTSATYSSDVYFQTTTQTYSIIEGNSM